MTFILAKKPSQSDHCHLKLRRIGTGTVRMVLVNINHRTSRMWHVIFEVIPEMHQLNAMSFRYCIIKPRSPSNVTSAESNVYQLVNSICINEVTLEKDHASVLYVIMHSIRFIWSNTKGKKLKKAKIDSNVINVIILHQDQRLCYDIEWNTLLEL